MGLIMFHLLSQEQKEFGRRAFLKAAALFPAIHSVAQPSRRDEPVKAVIVGTGDQGQVLLEQCNPKFLHIQAVCDIRPANRLRGQTLAQKRFGNQARAYLDYQEMLQQEEDIDAVLIATPLWMHAPVALAALQAENMYSAKRQWHTRLLNAGKCFNWHRRIIWCSGGTSALLQSGISSDLPHDSGRYHR